jgi:hypothetical protein
MPPDTAPGASRGRQLFVYYRVAASDLDACVRAVRTLQAGLAQSCPSLHGTLLQRPEADPATGQRTLMEIYGFPGGIDAALQEQIAQAADALLAPWLAGPRHVEVFEACA